MPSIAMSNLGERSSFKGEKNESTLGDHISENSKVYGWGCGIFWGIGILLIIILIPSSIRDVSHSEYAIRYDGLTKKVYKEVVTEGKYVYTPETELIYFNKIVKTLKFKDFVCITNDGISIDMRLDVQYQLPKNKIFEIFWTFGNEDKLKRFMKDVIHASIRDTCGNYIYSDFPDDRATIQQHMENQLEADFLRSGTNAELIFLELTNYEFPDSLNTAIDNKQTALQDITNAENERAGELTDAETNYNTKETQALTLINQAKSTAIATLNKAEEEVEAISKLWLSRLNTYNVLMKAMNMTADEFVNEYLAGVVLNNAKTAFTSIGF